MTAAVPMPGRNMGQPIARVDGVAKVTGAARYASDVPHNHAAHAFLVLSDIGHGRIAGFDEAAARAVPGVLAIMTHQNRPPVQPIRFFFGGGPGLTGVPPLGGPEVSHDGQIVAMVVAETYEAAREAGHRLAVRYDGVTAPASVFDAPGVVTQTTKEAAGHDDPTLGDAAAAIAAAPVRIDARYSTPPQHHNSMELYSTTAHWDGDELVIDEPNQFVVGLREGVSTQLAMDREKVRIRSEYLGGAFGGKAATTQRTALVALAARQLGRPVKLVATRDAGFTIAGHRQETRHRVQLGAQRDGKLTGYHHELWELAGRDDPYCNAGVDAAAMMYDFPTVGSKQWLVRADRNTPCFMRSPPEVPVMYALESAMDELAHELGMDPVELRRRNDTLKDNVSGKPYSSRSLMQCYDTAAAHFGWADRPRTPASRRDGDWMVGYGCATACYPAQMASSLARVTLTADGRATVESAIHDVGQGAKTIAVQLTAEMLGLEPGAVTAHIGDSALPAGALAGGSVTTASVGSAIKLAVEKIRARLGNADPADADARAAAFERLGTGAITETGEYSPEGTPPNSVAGLYKARLAFAGNGTLPRVQFAMGAEFVEVRVHARTREVRVPRIVGAFAAGRIVNPRTVHSQLVGGMIWGIGSALHEATEIDARRGAYMNNNLAEYLIPVNADIGTVDALLVPEEDSICNPVGIKGVGELGNVGTAAAITSAIFNATGKRLRDLPVRVEHLLDL